MAMLELGESGSAMESGSFDFNSTSYNSSLSCAARNIQGSAVLPYSNWGVITARVVNAIYMICVLVFGSFLNLFLFVLVAKFKKLQTVSFGIALQIAVLNLFLSGILNLISLINSIANRWVFGEHICGLVGVIASADANARSLLMFAFVINRFFSVFCPFSYPRYKTKTVVILSIAAFVIPLIMSSMGYVLDCYIFRPSHWLCAADSGCSKSCSLYLPLTWTSVFIVSRIIALSFFVTLFWKARKAKKAMMAIGETVKNGQQPKQDWKATITFFMLFMSLFVLSIPSLAIFIITDTFFKEEEVSSLLILQVIAAYILFLLPIVDPIIIMRNPDVKEVIRKVIKMIQSRNNNQSP